MVITKTKRVELFAFFGSAPAQRRSLADVALTCQHRRRLRQALPRRRRRWIEDVPCRSSQHGNTASSDHHLGRTGLEGEAGNECLAPAAAASPTPPG